MKIQDLEDKISIRANAVVQEKIARFKREIDEALVRLFGKSGYGGDSFGGYHHFDGSTDENQGIPTRKLAALKLAIRDTAADNKERLPWPSILWDAERDNIRTELLDKMDIVQRLLLTTARKTDADVPEEVAS